MGKYGTLDVRDELDRYYTPQPLADVLVRRFIEDGFTPATRRLSLLEPSVGGGAFALAARSTFGDRASMHVMDIDPNAPGLRSTRQGGHRGDVVQVDDFLLTIPTSRHDVVLGNPPYRQAELHVRKALASVVDSGVVGMLLRLAFLEGKCRIPFWAKHPAAQVYALSERPSFTGNGGTDATAYGFFVWQQGFKGKTQLEVLSWKSRAANTTETQGLT